MATKALWTTSSPDTLETRGTKPSSVSGNNVHAAAHGITGWCSLSEEKTGSMSSVLLELVPLDLLIALWEICLQEITPVPSLWL